MKTKLSKLTMLLAMLLFCANVARASGESICFNMTDGSRHYFNFEDKPTLTIDGNTVSLKSKNVTVLAEAFSAIHKITFDSPGSVASIEDNSGIIDFRGNGNIIVGDFSKDQTINVVSMSGLVLKTIRIAAGETVNLNLSDMSAGIYVISAGSLRYKVILK